MPVHPFGGRMSRHLGRSLAPDESAYLSYYDVRLTKYDVVSLRNDWLTDNTIDFWEEYLQREFLTEFKNSKIVLLQTGVAMMLKDMRVQDMKVGVDLPDLNGVTHMFVPVNDDDQTQENSRGGGGSHWSLVLVSLVDGVAFYYDSIRGTNIDEAARIIAKLGSVLGMQLRFIPLNDTPQQENGSDCGVYVCMFMEHLLLRRLLSARTSEKVSMSMGGKEIDAREGRKKMLRVIEERRKEGEKRRSSSKSPGPASKSRSPPRIDSPMESDR